MNNGYFEKMDALIESWEGEMIDTLRGWISVPSVAGEPAGDGKPFGEYPRQALDKALSDAAALGFETDNVDGYAGAVQFGSGDKTLGILCHLDVVPAGDGWTFPPFELSMSEGKMYGRGISDDKGPAVAALYAMRAVRDSGVPMKNAVRLILGCDEETGMKDMRYYAEHRGMPDFGFSPDAEFPVINIEKGGMTLKISKEAKIGENALIPIYDLNAGVAVNVVPGKAYATVGTSGCSVDEIAAKLAKVTFEKSGSVKITDIGGGKARIEAEGLSAHASTPHLGVNAVGLLMIALKAIDAGSPAQREFISVIADKIGLDGDGSGLDINISDEESGALTCNLGLLRYENDVIYAVLDCRVPICGNPEELTENAVRSAGPSVRLECLHHRGPHYVPVDSEIVQNLLSAYNEVTSLPAYAFAIGGGTYSRMMPNTVAFGITFPGDNEPCHMPDECIEFPKFLLSVRIFAHAIARLAGDI